MGILKRLEDQTTGDDPIPIRADDAPGKESRKRETALYASTNLTFFETNRPHDYGRDYVAFFGTCFPAARSRLLRLAAAQDGLGQEGHPIRPFRSSGLR